VTVQRTWLAVAGELLAAEATTAPDRSLQLADVIYSAASRPLTWPHAILHRYPGCAVAAVPVRDGGYAVAVRADNPGSLVHFLPNGLWLRVPAEEPGFGAIVCATLVHSWLAAGCPLAALDQAHLATIAGPAHALLRGLRDSGFPEATGGPIGLWRADSRIDGQGGGQLLARLAVTIQGLKRVGERHVDARLLIPPAKALHDRERLSQDAHRPVRMAGLDVGLAQAGEAAGFVVGVGQGNGHAPGAEQLLDCLLVPPRVAVCLADVACHAHNAAGNAGLLEDLTRAAE